MADRLDPRCLSRPVSIGFFPLLLKPKRNVHFHGIQSRQRTEGNVSVQLEWRGGRLPLISFYVEEAVLFEHSWSSLHPSILGRSCNFLPDDYGIHLLTVQ